MKLNEIKNLLADTIETYSTTIRRKEGEDLYEYEYEVDLSKLEPTTKFLNVLFGQDTIYEKLKDFEVESIYCGQHGFIINLKMEDETLLENIAKENKIPVNISKYIVTD